MTTSVNIAVPTGAKYRARIINYDLVNDEWADGNTNHVKPGEADTFHVWDTRCLTVQEVPLETSPKPE